jgi:putative hemolysin
MRPLQKAILCVLALATWGCTRSEMSTAQSVALANPAAVDCVNAGGKLIPRQNPQGEYVMCMLPSGKVCEAWALFRGECS